MNQKLWKYLDRYRSYVEN